MAIAKKGRGRPKKKETLELVAFRLAPGLIQQLEVMAEGEVDDGGAHISHSAMARRIVVEAIKRRKNR